MKKMTKKAYYEMKRIEVTKELFRRADINALCMHAWHSRAPAGTIPCAHAHKKCPRADCPYYLAQLKYPYDQSRPLGLTMAAKIGPILGISVDYEADILNNKS
jgi:hypothetical protein